MYAVMFIIAAVFGLRGSLRVTRRYFGVRAALEWQEELVLGLLAAICWTITVAAGFYGFLSVRTLAGFPRIPELAPISAVLAIAILFLPTLIDSVVDRVARIPWQ